MDRAQLLEALRLRTIEGLSYSQVAQAMGITKWQARRLCDAGAHYLRGVSDGFRICSKANEV